MLSRKHDMEIGQKLPESWTEQVVELLDEVYGPQIKSLNKCFEVFGFSYEDEVLFIISLVGENDPHLLPTSLFLSADIDKSTQQKKLLNHLVDAIGVFFDHFFQTEDWNDYSDNWQDTEYQKQKIFYKVTRENVALTLRANEILEQDNEDQEF